MFKLKFDTNNAAFEGGNGEKEVSRILREISYAIEDGKGRLRAGRVRDINGNDIGTWGLTIQEKDQ